MPKIEAQQGNDSLFHSEQIEKSIKTKKQTKGLLKKEKSGKWIVIPILYYLPETKLGLGGAGAYTYKMKNQSELANPSQIQFVATYTLENQLLLSTVFKNYFGENDYYIFGELGYYKYFYRYFGIGPKTKLENEETYRADYPRFVINITKQWKKGWFLGPSFWYDQFNMREFAAEGALINSGEIGVEGGPVMGAGLRLIHDTRRKIFYPRKGFYGDVVWRAHGKAIGSKYSFTNLDATLSKYFSVNKKAVIATNLVLQNINGGAPFYLLALHGGAKKGRGYEIGRYRDNTMLALNVEWRQEIGERFGAVAFAHYGGVGPAINDIDISTFKYSMGVGFRFKLDKANHLNIRVDYGVGQESSEFYLTVGEAF